MAERVTSQPSPCKRRMENTLVNGKAGSPRKLAPGPPFGVWSLEFDRCEPAVIFRPTWVFYKQQSSNQDLYSHRKGLRKRHIFCWDDKTGCIYTQGQGKMLQATTGRELISCPRSHSGSVVKTKMPEADPGVPGLGQRSGVSGLIHVLPL